MTGAIVAVPMEETEHLQDVPLVSRVVTEVTQIGQRIRQTQGREHEALDAVCRDRALRAGATHGAPA